MRPNKQTKNSKSKSVRETYLSTLNHEVQIFNDFTLLNTKLFFFLKMTQHKRAITENVYSISLRKYKQKSTLTF